jgi:hypothetical protein
MQLFEGEAVRYSGSVNRGDEVVHPETLVEAIDLIRDFIR